jgi:uncharacterized membrane protein YhaH (DUF805 family)
MNYYTEVLQKYAVFSGRARRAELWMFALINLLISIGLAIVDSILGTSGAAAGSGVLGTVYSLAVLIPSIAVGVRRLHDTGRSGWWYLIVFVPLVGWIALIYFWVLDSQPGSNQYGPNPKGEPAAA